MPSGFEPAVLDESYRPLPALYLALLAIWFVSASCWMINTCKNRHFQFGVIITVYGLFVSALLINKLVQTNNLQWTLTCVPLIKALQLTLGFTFWYSCFNLQICSLWMSFGVYVTGVLFETASLVSLLLISHGYSIICERLSVPERRTTAALGCALYLTLVGYGAAVPYFNVLLLLNYFISFYAIFHHVSQNLSALREQLSFIEDEDIHTMREAVYAKYILFKKFQGAMQILAVAETVIHMKLDAATDSYWLSLAVHEWVHFCVFLYIGWTFRSKELSPRFSLMPNVKSKVQRTGPPIYSIEMDVHDFKDLASNKWNIGVPASFPPEHSEKYVNPLLVIVQHPCASSSHGLAESSAPTLGW